MACVEVAFEIWVKRLRVEDNEAYQGMRRMSYENIPRNFEGYFSHITTSHFDLSPFFGKTADRRNYHLLSSACSNDKNYHQLSCRIWTSPNYIIIDNSRLLMHDSSCSNARGSRYYHECLDGALLEKCTFCPGSNF